MSVPDGWPYPLHRNLSWLPVVYRHIEIDYWAYFWPG